MITPRSTRLIRTSSLRAFRRAVAALAVDGHPLLARDRLVVVPTRAAATLLTSALEREYLQPGRPSALVLPSFVTAHEVAGAFSMRAAPALLTWPTEAREILMGVACRRAVEAGHAPPFRIRPGLVAEVLHFYDQLQRLGRDVDTFERLTLGRLEPGADIDRGAGRLVEQTRFLAETFRVFEQLSDEHGCVDDRVHRQVAINTEAAQPWRHAVITVGDESRDRFGLSTADWALLTRVPGLARIDVVVTDQSLAGEWHERVHQLLPGIEEVRFEAGPDVAPRVRVPADAKEAPSGQAFFVARDREDEIADFARWVRATKRDEPDTALEAFALVVHRPLPYVYLAQEVLRSANIECQTFDALPLAGEPFASALDLLIAVQATNLSPAAIEALLASPHFDWQWEGAAVSRRDAEAVSGLLREQGFLGGVAELRRIVGVEAPHASAGAIRAARALDHVVSFVEVTSAPAPAADHLAHLLDLLRRHGRTGSLADERRRRARAAVMGLITSLRAHYLALDAAPVDFETVAAVVRRAIEGHTFTPQVGNAGVYIVDDETARFGNFERVQVAGLVEGEWPDEPSRNIFYGGSVLRELGWPTQAARTDHVRASVADLLTLPSVALTLSTFGVEDDAVVSPSVLLDGIEVPEGAEAAPRHPHRILEAEALAFGPAFLEGLPFEVAAAVQARLGRPAREDLRFHGRTKGHSERAFSLSRLERYQDCPFRYFSANVLGLVETPAEEPVLSPRARGRFVHEVFERFYREWDAGGTRPITAELVRDARTCFEAVAAPLLERLGEPDASLERARLFGSAVATGVVDVVLDLEAATDQRVVERWVESRFEGEFAVGADPAERVPLRGVVDRVDLLDGRRLRVIDYKTGRAPDVHRALQVPVYALCVQEQLEKRDGRPWHVHEAFYVSFTGPRALVPVIASDEDPADALSQARERLTAAVAGVHAGAFPPAPHDTALCRTCAFTSVCRKDYVHV